MDLYIENEFSQLQAVLVHRPGPEIDRLNYHNMRRFLFEDIPYLARMQDEHDEFVGVLQDHEVQVVYLENLLQQLISSDREAKESLVHEICDGEGCPQVSETLLSASISNHDLVQIMFTGLTVREYKNLAGLPISGSDEIVEFVLPPIPNAYFSRDPAVVVKSSLISCKMHYRERIRESIMTRALLEWHPSFQATQFVYGGSDSPQEQEPHTVEGGDVLVLNTDALMIGVSERTTWQAIERIATNAFEIGNMKRLYEITIPAHRDYMHLDTVFTVVDRGIVVWYPQVMEQIVEIERYEPREREGRIVAESVVETRSLRQILVDEFERDVTIIHTAGGHPHYAPREQRTDGTNVLTVAPRKVVMYERNFKTREELERHGIETLVIPGSELVRGLGGPRCMSMPLRRQQSVTK